MFEIISKSNSFKKIPFYYFFLLLCLFDVNTSMQSNNEKNYDIQLPQLDDNNISIDGYLDEEVWKNGTIKYK